ncbi:ExbD/TolR family protein [Thalassovita taeanensis]|uniref:Outer membrane transport energization protein ExbD n=1 Tax=Thalassovita taeanensis TaxID=657014 RepID=A0A1H8Z9L9_9RHOB|nr:biopolymer transporter ExbD [Thalassovita taeanensis]SEP61125.1 outer membrane transport energization protein ExbD [Thalassovita taeanensis]
MRIPAPTTRKQSESILPMINVVFLLLIFFLITAQIRPPEPVEVKPPLAADGETAKNGTQIIFLDAAGELYFQSSVGDQVYSAIAQENWTGRVQLRVDARTPAPVLARVMRRLAEAGGRQVDIVVRLE